MQPNPSASTPVAMQPPAGVSAQGQSPQAQSPPPVAVKTPATSVVASVPLLEFWSNAAFTGVQGGLLWIAMASLLGTTWLGSGAWLLLVAGLFALQMRRVIERYDLLIIAGVTLGIVLLFPPLRTVVVASSPHVTVIVLAILAGLAAIAIGTLFRLIYRILSTFM